jgi:hypothetical protein
MINKIMVYNISEEPVTLTELGDDFVLAVGANVDFMETYRDSDAVLRAANDLPNTTLYQALHSDPPVVMMQFEVSRMGRVGRP